MKLELTKADAIKFYNEGNETTRKSLVDKFGKEIFVKQSDWMTMWKEFCIEQKLKLVLPYPEPANSMEECIDAHFMLIHIIEIKNKGWIPDFKNENEYKYYPWFYLDKKSGFAFSDANYDCAGTGTGVGSRLCFFSRDAAEETAKAFLPIYEKYHM